MSRSALTNGWSALERRSPTGGVDSVQRIALSRQVVPATPEGALELAARYWAEVERSSRGLVRVRRNARSVSLVLAGRLTLFRFGAGEPILDGDDVECRFEILGGGLVARPGGSLSVVQRTGSVSELELAVTGYYPRLGPGARAIGPLRRLLYWTVQRPLHLAVSRRFLRDAARSSP